MRAPAPNWVRGACCGDFITRVALFHTDATSADPDANWGEVIRVFPPNTPPMRHLYGGRNDTEAGNRDLKRRVKWMPADVAGQELRLVGAFLTINAIAWQFDLQAHGQPNVLDDTA